jgi:4-amino-4-deoxy-L-arabinose transferase-like glycosyltransferase
VLNDESATGAVLALLGIITVLRLVALWANSTELFVDEAQYWSWSLTPAFGYFSKPPLIAWIISASTSVCGHDEICVRLPSVLLHAATGFLVFLIGRKLYSPMCGLIAAVAYATLPGVSLSSGIISTDVPLLFAWALALLAFVHLVSAPTLAMAGLLGLALGLGLNAKYAMAYFIVCAALYFIAVPTQRSLLKRAHLWIALALGLLLIAPNVVWNASNSFATFSHTADNAKWSGSLLHPGKALEFLATQFGVMGPILFGALLVIVWRARKGFSALPESDRLLLAFSVPVIALITTQAFLSRAHANWAATAYIAAVVLVTAVMMRDQAWTWLRSSLAINTAIAVAIAIATWQAGSFTLPGIGDPFARTLGNRALADAVKETVAQRAAAGSPLRSILVTNRESATALLYYARDLETLVTVWRARSAPANHFELTRPFIGGAKQEPALLLLDAPGPRSVLGAFGHVTSLGRRDIPAGRFTSRAAELFVVSGYKGR